MLNGLHSSDFCLLGSYPALYRKRRLWMLHSCRLQPRFAAAVPGTCYRPKSARNMWTMMIGSCMYLRAPFTHETRSCAPLHDRQKGSMSLTANGKKDKQFCERVPGGCPMGSTPPRFRPPCSPYLSPFGHSYSGRGNGRGRHYVSRRPIWNLCDSARGHWYRLP